jgi:glucokinase
VPGPVNPWTGVIASAPNLPGWRDVPFKEIVEAALGLPAHVGNDANLAALGEHSYGAGRGDDDMIYLTVSTGIGGGIIADGRLVLGTAGLAGEPGHMTILPDGPPCNCGNTGCLEVLASGTAIGREARRRLAAGEASALAGQPIETVDAEDVVRAARAGDRLAAEVFGEAMGYLGVGVANLVHLFNPRAIIIGGGVSNAGDLLFHPVREAVRRRCMAAFRQDIRIIRAKLGDDVGLLGAAALAFRPAWQVR